jgi:hypothetical protein
MAIAWVQTRALASSDGGATSIALAAAFTPTAGNTLILGVDWTGATTASVSDGVNTWQSTTATSNGDDHTQIWYAENVAASSVNPTVTFSGSSTFRRLKVSEYSGLATSSSLDKQAQGTGTGTAPTATTATTTQADELVVVSAQFTNDTTITAGSGFTKRIPSAGTSDALWEDKIVAATGTQTGSCTLAVSSGWGLSVATFKAAAAGGEDIDVENRVVRVRQSVWRGRVQSPKTANALREFAISEPLAERLSSILLARDGDSVRLLWKSSKGTPWDANLIVKRKLHPILQKLGIARTGLHAFRHGNATILDRNHVPIKLRQTRLGHSDTRMAIGRYAHVVGEDDRKIASTLGELLKPPITEVIQ